MDKNAVHGVDAVVETVAVSGDGVETMAITVTGPAAVKVHVGVLHLHLLLLLLLPCLQEYVLNALVANVAANTAIVVLLVITVVLDVRADRAGAAVLLVQIQSLLLPLPQVVRDRFPLLSVRVNLMRLYLLVESTTVACTARSLADSLLLYPAALPNSLF